MPRSPVGAFGAERLDFDPTKPRALVIHRHPFGERNDVRVPAALAIAPSQWLGHLEELIIRHFHDDL